MSSATSSTWSKLPEGDYQTLAGLVVTHLGHIPRISETFELLGPSLRSRRHGRKRVDRVLVSRARKRGCPLIGARPGRRTGAPCEPPRLDHASLHHGEELRSVFEHGDVGQDVAVDDQQVGELSRLRPCRIPAPGP